MSTPEVQDMAVEDDLPSVPIPRAGEAHLRIEAALHLHGKAIQLAATDAKPSLLNEARYMSLYEQNAAIVCLLLEVLGQ